MFSANKHTSERRLEELALRPLKVPEAPSPGKPLYLLRLRKRRRVPARSNRSPRLSVICYPGREVGSLLAPRAFVFR